jgi:hypothetical protein
MDLTSPGRAFAVPRVLCALVAFAAGLVGVLMVAAPGSSGTYFSWALGPAPLASLVGAFYVASAFVFGWAAARADWAGMRGLCVAVFGLTVPTLAATSQHLDVFDFTRWQAIAWVALFIASPILFGASVFLMRGGVSSDGPSLPGWARWALGVQAVAYGSLAVLLWAVPDVVSRNGPFAVAGLGAGFAGAWAAFLAVTAGFAAWRDRWHEARLPLVVLVAWPAAAIASAATRADELQSGNGPLLYLGGLGLAGMLSAVVLLAGRARVAERDAAVAIGTA